MFRELSLELLSMDDDGVEQGDDGNVDMAGVLVALGLSSVAGGGADFLAKTGGSDMLKSLRKLSSIPSVSFLELPLVKR